MRHGSRNVDIDPFEPEDLPEERLWKAVLRQAVLDACSMTEETARSLHDNSKARYWRRDARFYFEQRSPDKLGWQWLVQLMGWPEDLVDEVDRRIEADQVVVHPFVPKAQAELRMAGVVKKVRKAAVVVKKLQGQLGFAFCDNTPQQTAPVKAVRRPVCGVMSQATTQGCLWAD